MINNVHLSPRTSSDRATGQLDRPCLMCDGMTAMLPHRKRGDDDKAAALLRIRSAITRCRSCKPSSRFLCADLTEARPLHTCHRFRARLGPA
jgi:hypothetical protein